MALDRIEERIQLAKDEFGATYGLNTTGVTDLVAAMNEATSGLGPTVVIESESASCDASPRALTVDAATGHIPIMQAGVLAVHGSYVQIGAPTDRAFKFEVGYLDLLLRGLKIIGSALGDGTPREFVPRLIQYYREGKLPGMLFRA